MTLGLEKIIFKIDRDQEVEKIDAAKEIVLTKDLTQMDQDRIDLPLHIQVTDQEIDFKDMITVTDLAPGSDIYEVIEVTDPILESGIQDMATGIDLILEDATIDQVQENLDFDMTVDDPVLEIDILDLTGPTVEDQQKDLGLEGVMGVVFMVISKEIVLT